MRLIDADELMKHKGNCYDEEGHLLYAVGTGTIMMMPTIDAVPVVRCKDCKECEIDEVFHDYWCNGRKVWKDHYCACGERRTDETD